MSGPPSAISLPSAGGAAAAAPAVTLAAPADPAALPPALAGLSVGQSLSAQVLAAPAAPPGQPAALVLQTPDGPLAVRTALAVPPGASLTLQVVAQGAALQFRIAAIDGQPVSAQGQSLAAAATPGGEPPATTTPAATAGTAAVSGGAAGIAATLLAPAATASAALPPGSTLVVRLEQVTPPATPETAATAADPAPPQAVRAYPQTAPAPQAATAAAPPPAAAATTVPTPTAAAPTVPPPATATANPTANPPTAAAPAQPPSPAAATPASAAGSLLPGTATAASRPGAPMLQTPLGLLALQGGPDLPSGSTVLLRLATAPMPPPAPAPATAPDLPFAALSRALVTLPPALAAELGAVLPAIGDEAHPLALRLKALAEAAAGEEDPALADAGAAALLRHALDSQKSLVTLPGSGPDPWQCYLLPLMLDGTLRPLRLVMRERPRDARAKARRREEGTRFLMDLEMTRLGPMQFDGLVKAQAKRFDLIIRSHAALTRDLKDGITAVFTATLDGFGMSGLASFVHTPHFILPRPLGPENAPGAETFMA